MTKAPAIYCALDRPDLAGALALARSLKDVVDGFKVGLEFVTANGPDGVRRVVQLGLPVFLDLKFHDIPNTVAGAIEAARVNARIRAVGVAFRFAQIHKKTRRRARAQNLIHHQPIHVLYDLLFNSIDCKLHTMKRNESRRSVW